MRHRQLLHGRIGEASASSVRTVRLSDDGKHTMMGGQELPEGRDGERRGPHEYQIHDGLPLDPVALETLPFVFEHFSLQLAHAVPDEDAVEMVHFMLKGSRQITAPFEAHFTLLQI